MLYNTGKQFAFVFYDGKPVKTIYQDGKCIYPGIVSATPTRSFMQPFKLIPTDVRASLTAIIRSTTPPTDSDQPTEISENWTPTVHSDNSIYRWIKNTTIYWYSQSTDIQFLNVNKYSYGITQSCTNLTDISGLYDIGVSLANTIYPGMNSLQGAFARNTSLSDISSLANLDVSEIKLFYDAFTGCYNISDLTPLRNWDMHSAILLGAPPSISLGDDRGMFTYCNSITSLDGLETWNTSNVVSLKFLFNGCPNITDLTPISNWNTSKVVDMSYMFGGLYIESMSPISHWDVSSCTNFKNMFADSHLHHIDGVYWTLNGSSTIYTDYMFNTWYLQYVRNLYWDWGSTASATLKYTFSLCRSLKSADFSRMYSSTDTDVHLTMYNTFSYCYDLEYCDLGYFATFDSSAQYNPFLGCENLSLLIIRNPDRVATSSMSVDAISSAFYYFARNHGKLYVPQALLSDYQQSWVYVIRDGAEILPLEGSPYEEPGSLPHLI